MGGENMKAADIMVPVEPVAETELAGLDPGCRRAAGPHLIPVVDAGGRYLGCVDIVASCLWRAGPLGPGDAVLATDIPRIDADSELDRLPAGSSRAVVVDRDGRPVGTIDAADLLRHLGKSFAAFKEQFLAIINSAQNGILAVDGQGSIILVNKVAEEILGLSADAIIGRPITAVIPNTLMPKILADKKPLLGQRIRINNTTVLANYSPIIAAGETLGAVSVFQDISILESTSQELSTVRGLSQELEAIINSSYDGMFITDGQGKVLRINKAYERITGIEAGEVMGKTMRQLVEEKYYDQSVTLLVMEQKKSVTINQTVRGDLKILVTGNPVFDDRGELVRVVTNVRDVTELVKLRDQLAKTQEQTLKYKTELSHLRSMQIHEENLVFRSPAMARAVELARKIADVDSTILITGESGAGKEVIAKLIHKQGKGVAKPFIKINCAAIPDQLLESELFGYEGGAFTGAKKEGKPGLFELAHNGTLFLDEVGDLPPLLQAKLLRAIQEKEVVRVGGTKPITVNARIIAATHRDIAAMVKTGAFRQDLYYRLMVVPIHLPPLRERKDDIPLLARHFVDKFNKRFKYAKRISPPLVEKLVEHSWPGNVRELENVIERMMVTAPGEELTVDLLPDGIARKDYLPKRGARLKAAIEQTEAYLLAETHKEVASWPKVAEILGIDRATAFRKAAKYGLLRR